MPHHRRPHHHKPLPPVHSGDPPAPTTHHHHHPRNPPQRDLVKDPGGPSRLDARLQTSQRQFQRHGSLAHAVDEMLAICRGLDGRTRQQALAAVLTRLINEGSLSGLSRLVQQVSLEVDRYQHVAEDV